MFENTCTIPLPSDLFAQAVHSSEPLVAVGLSSGHVSTLRLPPVDHEGTLKQRRGSNGRDIVDTAWTTKRHKGSCRCLAYSVDGRSVYSAGTDGIVKAADSESGRTTGKLAIPRGPSGSSNAPEGPTLVHALSPQTFLLATDSGALHLYDLRDPAPSPTTAASSADGRKTAFTTSKPVQTHYPHDDSIESLTPLPPSSTSTSGFSKQWISTGGMTLALTDLRRGVLVRSEQQSDLLLSSLYVSGVSSKRSSRGSGEKAVVGESRGTISVWGKGEWDDRGERFPISAERATLDVLAVVPDGQGAGSGKRVAAGLGDGKIHFVQLGQNRTVGVVQHDELEGVVGLGFDVGGRMISGGGQVVKVWDQSIEGELEDDDEEADGIIAKKRDATSDDEDDSDASDQDGSSDEGEKPKKRRKKRKRGKGPAERSSFNFAGLD